MRYSQIVNTLRALALVHSEPELTFIADQLERAIPNRPKRRKRPLRQSERTKNNVRRYAQEFPEKTIDEIAQHFGISAESVSEILCGEHKWMR